MRNIKYILVRDGRADHGLGYHYIVNSEGMVLNPTDIRKPGKFLNDYDQCSIGIKLNGRLDSGTAKQRAALVALLDDLRNHFPSAKILGVQEMDEHHIKVDPNMNRLRRELSDIGYVPETED